MIILLRPVPDGSIRTFPKKYMISIIYSRIGGLYFSMLRSIVLKPKTGFAFIADTVSRPRILHP